MFGLHKFFNGIYYNRPFYFLWPISKHRLREPLPTLIKSLLTYLIPKIPKKKKMKENEFVQIESKLTEDFVSRISFYFATLNN